MSGVGFRGLGYWPSVVIRMWAFGVQRAGLGCLGAWFRGLGVQVVG